ncbi:hypothetical protein BS50DRAFT_579616 [Corynespora cassiicola Philippines]|uniref:Uncharacterized protein n=1 Tax=Corynespora cassiicola Philippines TaxID=1448308 RepID=A0A2T2N351_CORCC|nr:hypothetical protein BS50DRAFT_579616 [Corynespora cassiicola Philippines]
MAHAPLRHPLRHSPPLASLSPSHSSALPPGLARPRFVAAMRRIPVPSVVFTVGVITLNCTQSHVTCSLSPAQHLPQPTPRRPSAHPTSASSCSSPMPIRNSHARMPADESFKRPNTPH